MRIRLMDTEATLDLGRALARTLGDWMTGIAPSSAPLLPALMLEGGLGAGKTTLVRGLVGALPGGEQAEVSSPSFNLFNCYPTVPETVHVDCYRLEDIPADESLLEVLQEDDKLHCIEWPEYLERRYWPTECLHLVWHACPVGRELTIEPLGARAVRFLGLWKQRLAARMPQCLVSAPASPTVADAADNS